MRRLWPPRSPLAATIMLGGAIVLVVVAILGWGAARSYYYQGLLDFSSLTFGENLPPFVPAYRFINTFPRDGNVFAKRPLVWELTNGSKGSQITALDPYTYRDGMAGTEEFQLDTDPAGGVGIVVHGDETTNSGMIFTASKSGKWWFGQRLHGHFRYLQTPIYSNLINRQKDYDNFLDVLTRGDDYILYINYHFVGVYSDGALPSGHPGIYDANGATPTEFGPLYVYHGR